MKKSNIIIGDTVELMIAAEITKHGYQVCYPFGDSSRYDLVADLNGKFVKVQCKNGRYIDGTIAFDTCGGRAGEGKLTSDYKGEVDLFGVYCIELNTSYLIPVEDVGIRSCTLRITKTKYNCPNSRFAKDFLLSETIKSYE